MRPTTLGILLGSLSITSIALATTRQQASASNPPLVECRRTGGASENSREQHNDELIRWRARWKGSNCSVDLRASGNLKFNDDFTDIASIARGGFFEITEEQGSSVRRMSLRASGGNLERTWVVNGRDQPWDDAGRRWLADLLIDLDRNSAIGVDYRFPKIFAQGGAGAVIAEAEKMDADYAQSVYLRRLIEKHSLTDAEYERLVTVAARDIDSDYEISRILRAVAERSSLQSESMRRVYLRAVDTMSSDYERSRVLQTILEKASTSHEVGAAAIRTAGNLHSDYERSRVLLAAIGNSSLGSADIIPILETVVKSSSDYEKSRVMLAVAKRWSLDGESRKAYLRAADTIRSDYENRRVLTALVNQEPR
jgi:hypothetical protein